MTCCYLTFTRNIRQRLPYHKHVPSHLFKILWKDINTKIFFEVRFIMTIFIYKSLFTPNRCNFLLRKVTPNHDSHTCSKLKIISLRSWLHPFGFSGGFHSYTPWIHQWNVKYVWAFAIRFLSPEVALYLYKSTIRPCME